MVLSHFEAFYLLKKKKKKNTNHESFLVNFTLRLESNIYNCTQLEYLGLKEKQPFPETVTGGILLKNLFLEVSQNSQENSIARLSFLMKFSLY